MTEINEQSDILYNYDKLKELIQEPSIVSLVDLIISRAIQDGASNIHIEQRKENIRVRYRINGVLEEVMTEPKHIEAALISRIKEMAKLDIMEKRVPMDGTLQFRYNDKDYELHVSTLPTVKGEKIAINILEKTSRLPGINELGLSSDGEENFKKLILKPSGLIIVAGPSKTDKTRTLYAALNILNNSQKNISTVEYKVKRSEERRVGKECRSRWSPYH